MVLFPDQKAVLTDKDHGLNLDGASDFLASLGLKFTFALNGIIFPLKASMHFHLPNVRSMLRANGQKHASNPARRRHVDAVSRMNRLFRSAMLFLKLLPGEICPEVCPSHSWLP